MEEVLEKFVCPKCGDNKDLRLMLNEKARVEYPVLHQLVAEGDGKIWLSVSAQPTGSAFQDADLNGLRCGNCEWEGPIPDGVDYEWA